jgi:hypothetical protein
MASFQEIEAELQRRERAAAIEAELRRRGEPLPQSGATRARIQYPQDPDMQRFSDPTEGFWSNAAAGVGQSLYQTARGIGQVFGNVSEADVEEARRLDAPLMRTGGGQLGQIAGSVAQIVGPGAVAKAAGAPAMVSNALMPTSLPGNIAQGAAFGALQPVGEDESRLLNTAVGAGAGGLGYAVPGMLRGVRSTVWDPVMNQDRIVANTIRRFAADPDNLRMTGAPNIPGYQPTLAEATLDPGIARLESAARSASIEGGNAVMDALRSNNAARVQAIQGIAGDSAAMEAAKAARQRAAAAPLNQAMKDTGVTVTRTANLIDRILQGPSGQIDAIRPPLERIRQQLFDPYPDAARIADARSIIDDTLSRSPRMSSDDFDALQTVRGALRNRREGVPAADVLAELKGIRPKSKTALEAVEAARKLLKAPATKGKEDVARLYGVRRNIDTMMSQLQTTGIDATKMRELVVVKKALDKQLMKASPAFRTYLQEYTQASRPINQMQIGQELLDTATRGGFVQDAAQQYAEVPAMQAGQFMSKARDLDALAQRATGFKRARADQILEPQQMQTIRDVADSLERRQIVDRARPVGSDTFANLASNNVLNELGPVGSLLNAMPGTGTLMRLVDTAYKAVDVPDKLKARLAEVLADPSQAQAVLARVPRQERLVLERALAARGLIIANQQRD